jgi:hypothetical protein
VEQEFVFEAALVGQRTNLVVTAGCFGEKESVNHFHCNKGTRHPQTESTEKLVRIRTD